MNGFEKEACHQRGSLFGTDNVIGVVAGTDGANIFVSIAGEEPVAARLLASVDRVELMKPESIGREVLLMLVKDDLQRPIVIGVLESVLDDLVEMEAGGRTGPDTCIDGKRVVLEAEHEIELKCGKSSIMLKRNGKIIIKGSELLSRASGTNRIKGGCVGIN